MIVAIGIMMKIAGIFLVKMTDTFHMLKLISFLFTGCWHRWSILKEISLFDTNVSSTRPIGVRYILQCTKCGIVKGKDVD